MNLCRIGNYRMRVFVRCPFFCRYVLLCGALLRRKTDISTDISIDMDEQKAAFVSADFF